jgi:hypothetical protein
MKSVTSPDLLFSFISPFIRILSKVPDYPSSPLPFSLLLIPLHRYLNMSDDSRSSSPEEDDKEVVGITTNGGGVGSPKSEEQEQEQEPAAGRKRVSLYTK